MPNISSTILTQLNRLGGGFPPKNDFELGTYLAALASGRDVVYRSDFFTTGNTVTVYVEPATGSDADGDGISVATAFATAQRALDSIPDGFMAQVIIQVGAGDLTDRIIVFTPRPGGASSGTLRPLITIRGTGTLVATITPTSSTFTKITSGSGVLKAAQGRFACNAWGTPIVLGDYYLRRFTGVFTLNCFPVLASSDEVGGNMDIVNTASSITVAAYELITHATTIGLGSSQILIVGNRQYECYLEYFDVRAGAIFYGVLQSGNKLIGTSTTEVTSPDMHGTTVSTLMRGCFMASGGGRLHLHGIDNDSLFVNYFNNNVAFSHGFLREFTGVINTTDNPKLRLGTSDQGGTDELQGIAALGSLGGLDLEGASEGIRMSGSRAIMRSNNGNTTFDGVTVPIRLQRGAVLERVTGALTGAGTGVLTLESGSQLVAACGSATYTTGGNNIQVGAKAATTFAAVAGAGGENDFVDAAGAYLATSQGCRAS